DDTRSTFGKTYAGEPDELIEALRADSAVEAADAVLLTIPSQLGVDYNLHILDSFAEHVAPALGWRPNSAGPVLPAPIGGHPGTSVPGRECAGPERPAS